ncbi:MAG: Tim44 domain-containing protein [Betaproteobacteria bacterium]|nr:Tim44 domain-containing protein [Betaproteobacteria bacterium]
MKRSWLTLIAISLAIGLTSGSADAKRVGSGSNVGAQRAAPMQKQAATPAQQNPTAAKAAPAAAAAPAASGASRWMGPLAGLAAGLGLGWLLSQSGMGGAFGMLLMGLLAAVAVFALVRFLMRPKGQAGQSMQSMQYAGVGNETVAAPPPSQMPSGSAAAAAAGEQMPQTMQQNAASTIPAGFDIDGFLRQAKIGFVNLQDANDRGDVQALRDFTTDEMFESLKGDIVSRGNTGQHTEVVNLNASLLEVVTEGNTHWASVRFHGSLREQQSQTAESFEEVWHLQKPVQGGSGWLLAGIQQVS